MSFNGKFKPYENYEVIYVYHVVYTYFFNIIENTKIVPINLAGLLFYIPIVLVRPELIFYPSSKLRLLGIPPLAETLFSLQPIVQTLFKELVLYQYLVKII